MYFLSVGLMLLAMTVWLIVVEIRSLRRRVVEWSELVREQQELLGAITRGLCIFKATLDAHLEEDSDDLH